MNGSKLSVEKGEKGREEKEKERHKREKDENINKLKWINKYKTLDDVRLMTYHVQK